MMFRSWPVCAVFALACELRVESTPEPDADPPPARGPYIPEPPNRDDSLEVPPVPDVYSSLIVLDPAIVRGPLARSESRDAPLSFRAQLAWLASGRDALDVTFAWLLTWETLTTVGAERAPVTPRPRVRERLIDRWLAASEATGDAGLTWGAAPFRLIAVVNRVDLATDPCTAGGELRLVYTAVDPITGDIEDMTVSVDIPYPSTRTAADWARAWRDVGRSASSEDYATGLERLVREVLADADAGAVRVRTSEIELAAPGDPRWEMREFRPQLDRSELLQEPLERTPRADVDPERLSEYTLEHDGEIHAGTAVLPADMRAGAAEISGPDFGWSVSGVGEDLRHAFSVQTCNGCHGGEVPTLPFRHIAPSVNGQEAATVSRFLYDPYAPSDELRRRAAALVGLVGAACEGSSRE